MVMIITYRFVEINVCMVGAGVAEVMDRLGGRWEGRFRGCFGLRKEGI